MSEEKLIVNTQSLVNRCEYLERANDNLLEIINSQDAQIKELRLDTKLIQEFRDSSEDNRVWVWQSDGYDNSRTMASDLPVLIRASQLRVLLEKGETVFVPPTKQ